MVTSEDFDTQVSRGEVSGFQGSRVGYLDIIAFYSSMGSNENSL